jgi:hypothetical protein
VLNYFVFEQTNEKPRLIIVKYPSFRQLSLLKTLMEDAKRASRRDPVLFIDLMCIKICAAGGNAIACLQLQLSPRQGGTASTRRSALFFKKKHKRGPFSFRSAARPEPRLARRSVYRPRIRHERTRC